MMIWKDYNTMKDDFNVEWIRIGSTHCWDLPDYKKKAEDLNPISDLNQLKSDLSHLNRFQSPGPFVDERHVGCYHQTWKFPGHVIRKMCRANSVHFIPRGLAVATHVDSSLRPVAER